MGGKLWKKGRRENRGERDDIKGGVIEGNIIYKELEVRNYMVYKSTCT